MELKVTFDLKTPPLVVRDGQAKSRTDFGIPEDKDEVYVTERAAFRWIVEKKWYIDARSNEEKREDKQSRFYKFELSNLEMIKQMEQA